MAMTRIGYLYNPNSTGNTARPLAPDTGFDMVRKTDSLDMLEHAFADFRDGEIEIIVVDGGDGTVCAALAAARERDWKNRPAFAIIAHGNTNLIARKIGGWRGPDAAARFARDFKSGKTRIISHPVLKVEALGAARSKAVFGFILGLGAYESATRMARAQIAARGGKQVMLAIAKTVRSLFTGPAARALRAGVPCAWSDEQMKRVDGRCLIFVASVFAGPLFPGIAPFPVRRDMSADRPLRWFAVDAPGHGLFRALPFLARGHMTRRMRASGYRAGASRQLDLTSAGAIILDGETLDAGRYRITTEKARFLVPDRNGQTASDLDTGVHSA